jgi:RNA recognition motif-containing protein
MVGAVRIVIRLQLETRSSRTVDESRLFSLSKTMNTKLYIGNLSFDTSETDLRATCEQHGLVTDIHLPIDRSTNRPRGFAFVTMENAEGMQKAISAMNGKPLNGRLLKVNEAVPRDDRPAFSGAGGGKQGRY